MNIETQSMACAMKEALHSAFDQTTFESFGFEIT